MPKIREDASIVTFLFFYWIIVIMILLMEELLHHLGCIKRCKWDNPHIIWWISSIDRMIRISKDLENPEVETCQRGDLCAFAHSREEAQRRNVAKFFCFRMAL